MKRGGGRGDRTCLSVQSPSVPALVVRDAQSCLAEAVHQGLLHVPASWLVRAESVNAALQAHGLVEAAPRPRALAAALEAAQAEPCEQTLSRAAQAFSKAAIRLALIEELF